MRLARLGHPYLGLEAFATVGLRHGKRCGKDILTGSPGRDRGCAARNGAQLGNSHATCYEQIDGDHDSGQRWATVRELREAYEGNGAKRFDKVRTPPVETTYRRGGPGRATSAGGRGRGSAGMGTRTMQEQAPNAGVRTVHWACEVAIRGRGEGEGDVLRAAKRGGSRAKCGLRMGGARPAARPWALAEEKTMRAHCETGGTGAMAAARTSWVSTVPPLAGPGRAWGRSSMGRALEVLRSEGDIGRAVWRRSILAGQCKARTQFLLIACKRTFYMGHPCKILHAVLHVSCKCFTCLM